MRILRDFLDGVARVIDNNFMRSNEDAHRCFEAFDIEHPVRFLELHQIKRSQIAGGVIEEKVLTAWISRILPACSFAGMPFVYGGIELHPGIAADVSSFRDFAEQCPRIFSFAWRTVTDPPGPPFPVFQRRVHEVVAHPHAQIFILIHDRAIGVAVVTAVVSLLDQRPRFLLFLLLGLDEFLTVRMPVFQRVPLGGAPGFAAALYYDGRLLVYYQYRQSSACF